MWRPGDRKMLTITLRLVLEDSCGAKAVLGRVNSSAGWPQWQEVCPSSSDRRNIKTELGGRAS